MTESKMNMRLLIADDERDIADAIGIIMKYSGFECDVVYDGLAAYEMTKKNVYDCMIFDIMMPQLDGISLVSKLRNDGDVTPILLLTAKAEVEDRIEGINVGADDYLAKPFDKGELSARINGLIRRNRSYASKNITLGNTRLNVEGLELVNLDHSLRLSSKEVEVLSLLMTHSGKIIDEKLLIEKVWEDNDYTEGAITLYIGYLKNKLEAIQSNLHIVSEESGHRLVEI